MLIGTTWPMGLWAIGGVRTNPPLSVTACPELDNFASLSAWPSSWTAASFLVESLLNTVVLPMSRIPSTRGGLTAIESLSIVKRCTPFCFSLESHIRFLGIPFYRSNGITNLHSRQDFPSRLLMDLVHPPIPDCHLYCCSWNHRCRCDEFP